MSKTLPLIGLLTGLALGAAGCDSQASQQAEAQRHLDAALTTLQQANAGYIPGETSGDLLAYRQQTMDEALVDLNKVMSINAPAQKMQALRISADIDISSARHMAKKASLENAALNARSTVLLGYLTAMENSAGRAEALKPQNDKTLSELQAEVQKQQAKREALTKTIEQLDTKLTAETTEVKAYQAKADEGYAQAQALRDKAFVAKGETMYDLQDQASEAERQAAVQSASAERHQVVVDDLQARLDLAGLELDTVNQLLAELNGQINATRADTARQADQSAEAAKISAQAVNTLTKEYRQIAEVHAEAVQKPLTEAAAKVDKAVDDLKQAISLASSRDAESVRLQLLAAYVDQASIAVEHSAAVANLANFTGTLLHSVKTYAPESAGVFDEQLAMLNEVRLKLDDMIGNTIKEGVALAEEIAPQGSTPDEGDVIAIAIQQKQRLNDYESRRRL